jgi:hypothetical protein
MGDQIDAVGSGTGAPVGDAFMAWHARVAALPRPRALGGDSVLMSGPGVERERLTGGAPR